MILFIGIIIWIPAFIIPENYTGIISYAYGILLEIAGGNNLIITAVSFVLTIFTALLLNKVAIDNGLIGKVSTIVFVLYILISGSLTGCFHNNPVVWINFLMVFVWSALMKLPYSRNTLPIIFNASFLTGIASLFNSQLVFMFVLIWLAIFIHRIVTWRNLVVTLVGITMPYFLLLSWFFFKGQLLEESYDLFNSLMFDISVVYPVDYLNILTFTMLIGITAVSVLGTMGSLTENSINRRRNLLITVVNFFVAFAILIVFSKTLVNILLLAVPVVLLTGYWFSHVRTSKWYNFTLIVLLVFIILNQYLNLVFTLLEI